MRIKKEINKLVDEFNKLVPCRKKEGFKRGKKIKRVLKKYKQLICLRTEYLKTL